MRPTTAHPYVLAVLLLLIAVALGCSWLSALLPARAASSAPIDLQARWLSATQAQIRWTQPGDADLVSVRRCAPTCQLIAVVPGQAGPRVVDDRSAIGGASYEIGVFTDGTIAGYYQTNPLPPWWVWAPVILKS